MEQIASSPCPVFVVSLSQREEEWDALAGVASELAVDLLRRKILGVWHAASFDQMDAIASSGIEVRPTDSPIFVDRDLGKVLRYGGAKKVVLVLDPSALVPTYREVPANLPQEELQALKRLFPTEMRSKDGNWLWLTRLPDGDPRRELPYERDYARWIPGDPFDALKAVLVVGLDSVDLGEAAQTILDACTSPKWS
ncbi:MAG: hypothetical protein R3C39_10390 [Dehalococcoidia bacterium]